MSKRNLEQQLKGEEGKDKESRNKARGGKKKRGNGGTGKKEE